MGGGLIAIATTRQLARIAWLQAPAAAGMPWRQLVCFAEHTMRNEQVAPETKGVDRH